MAEEKSDIALPAGVMISPEDQVRGRTDRFVRTYANSIAVGFSSWDVALTFGDIIGKRAEDEKIIIEETVQILLTKEIAKALAGILLQKINEYESEFGEINLPAIKKKQQTAESAPTQVKD